MKRTYVKIRSKFSSVVYMYVYKWIYGIQSYSFEKKRPKKRIRFQAILRFMHEVRVILCNCKKTDCEQQQYIRKPFCCQFIEVTLINRV